MPPRRRKHQSHPLPVPAVEEIVEIQPEQEYVPVEAEPAPEVEIEPEPAMPVEDESKIHLSLSLDGLLYMLIILIGVLVRFFSLSGLPLEPGEATHAVAAWQIIHGEPSDLANSPFLTYSTALALLTMGASDASARFVPALFGSLLPLLPYFLRPKLGRAGTLLAAAMLALSPTLVWESRHLGNEIIAQFWALALLAAGYTYAVNRSRPAIYAITLSLAGLLLSGAAGYRWLPVLVILPFALRVVGAGSFNLGVDESNRRDWIRAGLIGLLALFVVTTGAFTNLRGVQEGLVGAIGAYAAEWGSIIAPSQPSQTWIRLVFYDTVVLLLLPFALRWWWGNRSENAVLTVAAFGGLVLLVVGALLRTPQPVLVPLILVEAAWLGAFITQRAHEDVRRGTAAPVGLGLLLVIIFGFRWLTIFSVPEPVPVIFNGAQRTDLWPLTLIPVLLFAGFTLLAWAWLNKPTALTAIAGACLVALMLVWLHNLDELNRPDVYRPFELITPLQTSPDVRTLEMETDTVTNLLDGRYGPGQSPIPIIYDVGKAQELQPLLAWYLRYYPQARPAQPGERSGANIIILPPDQPSPFQSASEQETAATASRQYIIATRWRGLNANWYDIWRWFVYRERVTDLDRLTMVMHVKR